jgi:fucose permease
MSLVRGAFSAATVLHLLAMACAAVLALVLALRFPPPAHSGTPVTKLLTVLRQRMVWVFGALLFFESGNENCVYVWAAKMVKDLLHLEAQRAALALLGISIALGCGRLLAALWLKWLRSRTLLLASAFITMAGAVIVLASQTFGGMVAGFVVTGLGMSAIFPTALGLAGDCFPHETGTVFGAVMTLALVGGAMGPWVGGWAGAASPLTVLAVPITAGAAIAILTLVASEKNPQGQLEV